MGDASQQYPELQDQAVRAPYLTAAATWEPVSSTDPCSLLWTPGGPAGSPGSW